MPMLPYDASRKALLQPGRRTRPVLGFEISTDSPLPGLAAECSRLAYMAFDNPAADGSAQLAAALQSVGYHTWAAFHDAPTNTQAFAAAPAAAGPVLLAFRGTEPDAITDVGTDLAFTLVRWAQGGRVHHGFAAAFSAVHGGIDSWLAQHRQGRELLVTGHSLGAALATLAASRWHGATLVTFGAPRVGDAAFVATVALDRSSRYVDCCDAVTQLPPALPGLYADTGPALYIDGSGVVRPGIGDAAVAADRAAARSAYLRDLAWVSGNALARDLADHAPINYVRVFT